MNVEDLIVVTEEVGTGKRLIGYVCGCKSCRTAFEHENYDHSRPIGLLTHPEELYGNVRVYTDNMLTRKEYLKELEKEYKIFIETEDGKSWIKDCKSRNNGQTGDCGDYIYDFYTEMLM